MCKLVRFNNSIFIALIGVLLISCNLIAQPQDEQHPPLLPDSNKIVQMVDELATALSLNEEQRTQVSELHFTHFKEAGELMEKNKAQGEKGREVMDALRKDFEEQVKALLSDEQKVQFETFLSNHGPQQDRKRPQQRNFN